MHKAHQTESPAVATGASAWHGLPFLAGLTLSAGALRFLPAPFVWIGWGWSITLLASAWKSSSGRVRAVFFNVAVLTILLAGVETYLAIHQPVRKTFSDGYMLEDDVLGTVPARGIVGQSTEYEHGQLAYDVKYTIDSNGLRVVPPPKVAAPASSVLFFGCSFTFGEGLQDDQTVPYSVGEQSGGRYAIYNFSFHGYGPNQMLAAIESGRVRHTVLTPPRYIIYTALPDHIARVAGKVPYGKHSPRYRLQPDGSVQLAGHFDDEAIQHSRLRASLLGNLRKSAIYRWIENLRPATNDSDLQLYLAVVRQSRDRLKGEYPGAEFHILLWRNPLYEQKTYEELRAEFSRMNIPTDLVENILPGYHSNPQPYWITPEDAHPNAMANRLIAQYVVTRILSR